MVYYTQKALLCKPLAAFAAPPFGGCVIDGCTKISLSGKVYELLSSIPYRNSNYT